MLYVASVCTPCWMLQRVVAQSLQRVKLFSQQLLTFLLFPDRQTIAQQCWIRLHSSSNIVGVTHAHYAWFTKTYGLYPSHDALQVPTLLGVVASVCTPLPTSTQQIPTLLAQQCWELLPSFARSLIIHGSILLVTIRPGAHPRGFVFFFFLGGLFPTPAHEERNNSPPPSSWSTSYTFFATSFLSVQKRNDTFSQLLWTFSWVYWEKDRGCHNVVKT